MEIFVLMSSGIIAVQNCNYFSQVLCLHNTHITYSGFVLKYRLWLHVDGLVGCTFPVKTSWFVGWVMKYNFYLFGQQSLVRGAGGQRGPHRLELNYPHSLLIINNKLTLCNIMLLSSKTLAWVYSRYDASNYFRIFILIQSCSVY